jgi:taurine dioxygenase
MRVQRLSAPLGIIVNDVDVTTMDEDQWQKINTLFCQHHVLVFPQQALNPEQQIAFAARWGELVAHPYAALEGYPTIIELENRGKSRDVNQHWHSDMTFNPSPPKLTMLYALKAPKIGGDTAFSNQVLAYAELSGGLKAVVDGLQAHHSAKGLARLYGENEQEAPRALHPVVRTHDESGERALYVCRAFTQRFEGWSREESESLLEYLFKHATRPEFQARHQWHTGDLVMWDNRSVLHYAVHDHGDDARVIHRCQVEGPRPC